MGGTVRLAIARDAPSKEPKKVPVEALAIAAANTDNAMTLKVHVGDSVRRKWTSSAAATMDILALSASTNTANAARMDMQSMATVSVLTVVTLALNVSTNRAHQNVQMTKCATRWSVSATRQTMWTEQHKGPTVMFMDVLNMVFARM